MTWSHTRNAAGICALCAGLMLGAGSAVAAADPGTNESSTQTAHKSHDGHKPSLPKPAGETGARTPAQTVDRLTDVVQKAMQDVTSVFGSGRVPGQPTTGGQATKPDTATTVDTPAVPDTTDVKGDSDPVTAVHDVASKDPDPVASNLPVTTPAPATTPVVTPTAPPAATVTPIPWVMQPVVTVLNTIGYVVTAAEYVATAAVYTVAYTVTPIATGLTSLLGIGTSVPTLNPLEDRGFITSATPGASVFAPPPVVTGLPGLLLPNTAGTAGLPTATQAGVMTPSAMGPASAAQESAVTGEVPLADTSIFPASLKQFFEHAVSAVLRSPSLSVLAALALPGFLGLLVITGAGMRFGYRQAKAALALPASKLARFAAPQPLRLVRSRSAVKLSRPASRFVPRELAGAGCALESAA